MLTLRDVDNIVAKCSYPGFWIASNSKIGEIFIQVICDGTNNFTKEPMQWKSRKWFISKHATKSEVVQTIFKAILTALEHEARELFTYRDVTVMNPHLDLDQMVDFVKAGNISERDSQEV